MAKISVVGKAAVLISAVSLSDYEKIYKYRPEALCLKDEDGNEFFKVTVGKPCTPNKFGISFNDKTNDEHGFACVTLAMLNPPEDAKALKEYLTDAFGALLVNLEKVEWGLEDTIAEVEAERLMIKDSINIIA